MGWAQQDDLDREELLQLARRLAQQRERQESRPARGYEARRCGSAPPTSPAASWRSSSEPGSWRSEEAPRRLRFRRGEQPPAEDTDRAYAEEILARREAEVEERARVAETRERELAERETALLARQLELEETEPALAERERRIAQATGGGGAAGGGADAARGGARQPRARARGIKRGSLSLDATSWSRVLRLSKPPNVSLPPRREMLATATAYARRAGAGTGGS